jgi:hypothetical protein
MSKLELGKIIKDILIYIDKNISLINKNYDIIKEFERKLIELQSHLEKNNILSHNFCIENMNQEILDEFISNYLDVEILKNKLNNLYIQLDEYVDSLKNSERYEEWSQILCNIEDIGDSLNLEFTEICSIDEYLTNLEEIKTVLEKMI